MKKPTCLPLSAGAVDFVGLPGIRPTAYAGAGTKRPCIKSIAWYLTGVTKSEVRSPKSEVGRTGNFGLRTSDFGLRSTTLAPRIAAEFAPRRRRRAAWWCRRGRGPRQCRAADGA